MQTDSRTLVRSISEAIYSGDVEAAKNLLLANPSLVGYSSGVTASWLEKAAYTGNVEMVKAMIALGVNIHAQDETGGTAVTRAVTGGHLAIAEHLLSLGADPNAGRALISAINREDDTVSLELVKLLIEHGADVNRFFPWFGNEDSGFTPLTFAEAHGKTEIAEYLRSKGAVPPPPKPKKVPASRDEEIVIHFEKQFGSARPGALREIVPTGLPVAIHAIPPSKTHNQLTFFTSGMSEQPMTVPKGQENYRYAELLIHLPADWPLTKKLLSDPKFNWPIRWLQETARYPHDNKIWLGGPFTIISKDPPQKIPGTDFTAMMLAAKGDMRCADGRLIQLYTLFPLYLEERDLEMKKGLPALMRALDKFSIPDVVNLNRINVATEKIS